MNKNKTKIKKCILYTAVTMVVVIFIWMSFILVGGIANEYLKIEKENQLFKNISDSPATRLGFIEEVYDIHDSGFLGTTTCRFKINNRTKILKGSICYGISEGSTLMYRDYNSTTMGHNRRWSIEFNESDFNKYLSGKLK